jgi:hypothetical protein
MIDIDFLINVLWGVAYGMAFLMMPTFVEILNWTPAKDAEK